MNGHIACVGSGLMGSGWATHFLHAGQDVIAWDPNPDAADYVRQSVASAFVAIEQDNSQACSAA